jgi:hypothetical protein
MPPELRQKKTRNAIFMTDFLKVTSFPISPDIFVESLMLCTLAFNRFATTNFVKQEQMF